MQMGLVGIPTAKRPVISQAEWNPVPLALQLASPHISLPPTATITVADRKVTSTCHILLQSAVLRLNTSSTAFNDSQCLAS